LRGITQIIICATVLSGAVLAVQSYSHFRGQTAVVTDANAMALSGPYKDAVNAFALHDGAELSVLDRHDDWWQVTDGSGRIGWLPGNQLELLPGA
jgi:SH3-like domain-containing protein